MIINYVPGLALRFFPGLSREPYDAVDTYVASNCKIAIFTGTAPTEQSLWNLTNFNDYVTANTDKLVYQETTQLQFSYDGYKHKRVIQRWPIDSTPINGLIAPIAQDLNSIPEGEDPIESSNNLYALVYCPDKDVTLNTIGNDLVFLLPGVGSGSTDFCSLSSTNFQAGDPIYFRNMTVALFQGYQITDTLITEAQDDPENPGQTINVPVDTKKSIYINKIWANRISEAYRDCFVSRTSFLVKGRADGIETNPLTPQTSTISAKLYSSALQDYRLVKSDVEGIFDFYLRKYDKNTQIWENSDLKLLLDTKTYYGFIVNESMINLLNEINSKALLKQFSSLNDLVITKSTYLPSTRFKTSSEFYSQTGNIEQRQDLIPGLLAKYCYNQAHASQDIKDSLTQLLIEQGLDEGMINSALRSVVPIDFDPTQYSSSFDKDQNILTIQNNKPAKLKTRYKKSIHNPTNEKLYILLPRYIARAGIEGANIITNSAHYSSISSVSYPATSQVLEGEVVDNSVARIRQQDFTAISIGQTGNGETDLEFDNIDVIDYIDSLTAMVKIPNKF